ncbi:MAG: hypothetical protein M3440_13275 [Chloroflexota bacterium]|nr:hypothetical protein [Chloroflexota bacterium]
MRHRSVPAGQQESKPTAYVLNVSLAGLGAIRSLGRAGVPVVGLDPDPNHSGFVSRYCDARQCPHPVHDPERLIEFLVNEGRRLDQPGVLSPASDAFVLFISRFRDDLKAYFRFNLPSSEVMEATVDKRKLYAVAASAGFAHADTHYPTDMNDIHHIKDELEYPVYIKPYYSHMWQVHFPGAGKGIKAQGPAELVTSFERIFPTGVEAMVQSIIVGPASNVRTVYVYITPGGEPLGLVATRKIRQYPVEFGRGSIAETFHDPAFAAHGLEFFQKIGYRGFGTIEFKLDDHDGMQKATDLNPRWVKPINLPISAGVNFPLIHYLDLIGETPAPEMNYRDGVRWLDAKSDVSSAWPSVRSRTISPVELGRSWAGARSFPSFAMDDLKPFLKEYDYGRTFLRAPLRLVRNR